MGWSRVWAWVWNCGRRFGWSQWLRSGLSWVEVEREKWVVIRPVWIRAAMEVYRVYQWLGLCLS